MQTFRTQLMGSSALAPPDDQPGGAQPVDPAVHATLVAAHDRLKRDAQADRDRVKAMETTLAELTAAKDDAEAAAAAKAGDIEAVKTQLKTAHDREIAKLTTRAEKAEGQVRKLVVDNGLSAALDEAGVAPGLKKAATAMLREAVELKDEANGDPVALMNGTALPAAVKAWASTEEGKHFVVAGNTGGDAPGARPQPGGENPWKDGAGFSLTRQDEITSKDPALASRLKAEAGVA